MSTLKQILLILENNLTLEKIEQMIPITIETKIYLDLLNKEVQSKNNKLKYYLNKVLKKETLSLERSFLEIVLKKKHSSSSFLERLFFSLKYKSRFTKYLKKYKNYKNKNDILLNIFYLKKYENKVIKNDKKIVNVLKESKNLEEILPFFKGIISDKSYYKFIKHKDIETFCKSVAKLEGEMFYKIVAKKIYKSNIKDTILLVNNLINLDNTKIYKHLINLFYKKKGSFQKFKKYFSILWIKDLDKLKILFVWLRIFIIRKEFDQFISLYKYLEEVEKEEMLVFKSFYQCVKEYKSTNVLSFNKFNYICNAVKDDNLFSCVSLQEISEQFNFKG